MPLILASTSASRRSQLRQLGIPFECMAPNVDEDVLKASVSDPVQLAEELALAKACAVADRHAAATVIGGDQLVRIGSRILGKPGSRAGAIGQLAELAGRTHQLVTAVAVLHAGAVHRHVDVTSLAMRSLTRPEIERYVDADQAVDCAGSYRIESRGITLFERVESQDHTAIVGLPLIALTSILRDCGYSIP